MNYLRGLIPWIAFAALSSAGWQWGALAGLVLALALLVEERLRRSPLDSQVLELSTIPFFATLAVIAFTVPDSPLKHYTAALSMGWLALTAWVGIAAGRPFTTGIAKLRTPSEYWETPVFRQVNSVISAAWAGAFTVTGIALAVLAAAGASPAVSIPVQIAGFVIPAVFTSRYPARVRARFAA